MQQIIARKRDRQALSTEEINHFIEQYTLGNVPDYQAAAWAMAVYLNGMNRQETVDLTLAMVNSGDQLDLHDTLDYVVDKHSSGGVGDKTTLVVLPLVAACGVPVAKMSGRGLGFTGGTLDKMESIPGWTPNLSMERFKQQVSSIGIALAGQTATLAPADGKLYALRDVTATVGSKPLIAASIMSKKLAAGADGIVLDVKIGSGAFLKTEEDGRTLAQIMVDIGRDAGRQVVALLSDMNQPLGHAIGNSLEVIEAINTLKNEPSRPADFMIHCHAVAKEMVLLAQPDATPEEVEARLTAGLESGQAFQKFEKMVEAQGGSAAQLSKLSQIQAAPYVAPILAPTSGRLTMVDTEALGWLVVELGGGRKQKGESIDHRVGFEFPHKIGNQIENEEPLAWLHAASKADWEVGQRILLEAIELSEREVEPVPHFYGKVA